MATISSVLKLQDKMSPTFSSAKRAADSAEKSFRNVNITVESIDSKMRKASTSSTSFLNSLLSFGIISRVFSMITSQLDSAIKRYDTLNNYTKVMSNLGVSEEAANASRERLATGLKGLPTTLDSAILAVQKFTSANDSVEASTEMYLAMNNAILAGGANMQVQQSAMEQLSQAYSKGKPDMMEWRALQQAMPGQLKQIAKAMGKTTDELGSDLRSGKTSMNEFMKTAVQLNQQGIDGFQSFEEQAKNATGGIQTSIANMQAAITRGWASMIEGANSALEASGLPTINELIVSIGENIENFMTRLGSETIPTAGEQVFYLSEQFSAMGDSIATTLGTGLDLFDYFNIGLQGLLLGLTVITGAVTIVGMVIYNTFYNAITGAIVIWYGLLAGVEGVMVAIEYAVQNTINKVIDDLNALVDAFNTVFGAFGANVQHISKATFADEAAQGLADRSATRLNDINNRMSESDKMWGDIRNQADFNIDNWSKAADSFTNNIANTINKKSASKAGGASGGTYDPSNIDKLLNNVTGSDGSGGKAIKTTTDDDLLSDDDIKLLLDVATRDYKLNYQQVTPNITLTFGDIRETADVDDILDQVADRLEEIYDGNLEVS